MLGCGHAKLGFLKIAPAEQQPVTGLFSPRFRSLPLHSPTNTPITINNALQTVLSIHIDKHLLGIHLLGGQLAAVLASDLSLQRGLSVDSLAALLSVHRLRARLVQRRQLALLADVVQQLHRRLRRQALLHLTRPPRAHVVIVVDLHHRGVRTRAQALHLQKREHAILRRLAVLDAQLLLQRLEDLLGAAQHAGSRSAGLDEELANLLARGKWRLKNLRAVHRVERDHLVDLHGRHLQYLRYLIHSGKR